MIYCKQCNKENNDGAKFCSFCGAPLDTSEKRISAYDKVQQEWAQKRAEREKEEAQKTQSVRKARVLMSLALCGIIAVITGLVFLAAHNDAVDVANGFVKYMIVECQGAAPYGTASVSVDWDAFQQDYPDLQFTDDAIQTYNIDTTSLTPIDWLKDNIWVTVDKDSNISVGDEITYTCEWINVKEMLGVDIPTGSGVYTVSEDDLGKYVESASDLTDEFLTAQVQQDIASFYDETPYYDPGDIDINSIENIGYILADWNGGFPEPNDSIYNHLYMVYRITAHYSKYTLTAGDYLGGGDVTYYCYRDCTDLILNKDGSYMIDESYGGYSFPDDSFSLGYQEGSSDWTFQGYQTLDELRQAVQSSDFQLSEQLTSN